jgi:hypothetical protein
MTPATNRGSFFLLGGTATAAAIEAQYQGVFINPAACKARLIIARMFPVSECAGFAGPE